MWVFRSELFHPSFYKTIWNVSDRIPEVLRLRLTRSGAAVTVKKSPKKLIAAGFFGDYLSFPLYF